MLSFSPLNKSYIFDRGYGHNKINQFGQQSRLHLRSILQEKHSLTLSLPKIKGSFVQKTQKKKRLFTKNERILKSKTQLSANPQFDKLQQQKIQKNEMLNKRIKILKQMHLFEKTKLKNVRYENQSKESSVMNDFHSPKTNGGFSRSKTGGIYYK